MSIRMLFKHSINIYYTYIRVCTRYCVYLQFNIYKLYTAVNTVMHKSLVEFVGNVCYNVIE